MPNIWDFFKATTKFIQKKQPVSYTGALIHPFYWLMSKTEDYICNRTSCNPKSQAKTRVYVVPGTADFPLSLLKLVNRLKDKKNLDDIISFTIVSFANRFRGKSIDEFSDELLDKILADKPENIVLIGHSRGGLVISKAALKAAKLGIKVKAVITLATPFNGSHLALPPLTWISTSVKQMEIESEYLKELTKLIVQSEISHHFMIAGNDEIVRSGAFIQEYVEKNPGSMHVFSRHGHLSLPTSHEVITVIYNIIKDDTVPELENSYSDESSYEDLFYPSSDDSSEKSLEINVHKIDLPPDEHAFEKYIHLNDEEGTEKSSETFINELDNSKSDESSYEDLFYLGTDEGSEKLLEITIREESQFRLSN